MDSSIASDPRFKLVAAALSVSWREVIGACFLVWLACYERRSKRLRKVEADVAAEIPGFADALVAEKLATEIDNDHVEIHGVEQRIRFLEAQAKRGAKGGKSRAKKAPSKRLANASGTAKATAEAEASGTAQANTLTPAPAPALTPAPEQTPLVPPSGGEAKGLRKSELERAAAEFLEGYNRHWQQRRRAAPWLDDVRKALAAGYTALQMRAASWAASERYDGDPEVARNFTPRTILRLKNRDGKNCLPQWLELAEAVWREQHGNESYPWLQQTELKLASGD